jgi:hypothetical protein
MGHAFLPLFQPCDLFTQVKRDLTAMTLECTLSGSGVMNDPQPMGCTPNPRPFTFAMSGDLTATWDRSNVRSDVAPGAGEFLLYRATCEDFFRLAADYKNSDVDASSTCSAPSTTCSVPAFSNTVDQPFKLLVSLIHQPDGLYTVSFRAEALFYSPCLSEGSSFAVDAEVNDLTFPDVMAGQTATGTVPIGGGGIDGDFSLIWA